MDNLINQIVALADQRRHTRGYIDRNDGGKFKYVPEDHGITADELETHLNGGTARGVYMCPDEKRQKSHFLVFDFDDKKAEGIAVGPTMTVARHLESLGVPHLIFRSGSGNGYHIWVFFESARRVDTIKKDADSILADIKEDGTKYVAVKEGRLNVQRYSSSGKKTHIEHGVEVLPKGYGEHNIAIPCGRKSVPMRLVKDDSIWRLEECTLDDLSLEFVPVQKRGPKPATEAIDIDHDDACDCFIKGFDVDERSQWGAAGICLQVAFGKESDWARDRWIDWSRTSVLHQEGTDGVDHWNQLTTASKYTPLSFWRIAKRHGYHGKWPFKATDERKLLALDFLTDVRILRDQSDIAYAELKPREWVRIDTNEFRNACALGMLRAYQKMPQEQDVKAALMIAQAEASEAEPENVDLRFARVGGQRYVFLADTDRTVIEIDENGWRANNDAPVQFRKGVSLPMAMPEEGSLDDLIDFLNVDEDSMVFLLAWMVTAIINPGKQCPIAVLDGSAGSAKSSTLSTLIRILDPKVGAQAGAPKTEDDLVVSAYQSAVMSFDNVDTLANMSDALCRLSTGGGLSKRKLYSDGDVFSVDAMRPLLIAGLDPTFYKQDLIERIVRVTLTRPKAYMDEEEFEAYREQNLAKWRGALYTLVSDVLRDVHTVAQTSSRFGVFSRVGECVARRLGYDDGWFGRTYASMRLEMACEAAAADSVYMFLTDFLGGLSQKVGTKWSGGATELFMEMRTAFADLAQMVSAKDIPGNARAISPRIVQASSLIEKTHGWRVSRGRRREFIFEKVADVEASAEDVLEAYRAHQLALTEPAGI